MLHFRKARERPGEIRLRFGEVALRAPGGRVVNGRVRRENVVKRVEITGVDRMAVATDQLFDFVAVGEVLQGKHLRLHLAPLGFRRHACIRRYSGKLQRNRRTRP